MILIRGRKPVKTLFTFHSFTNIVKLNNPLVGTEILEPATFQC